MKENHVEESWVSLILRLAMAALFLGAVVPKFQHGLESIVGAFQGAFKETWLPMPLVTLHARCVPWIEAGLVLWLITGFRLRWAWIVAGLFLTSLGFGMIVVGKGDVAASNFNYVLISCVGLYFSRYDRWSVDGISRGSK